MKLDLVAVLAILNELLRRVANSLAQIHQTTGGLVEKERLNGTGVRINSVGNAGA